MMVIFLAMLPIMSRSHLLWILSLRLGLTHKSEPIIFQLSNFLFSEFSRFGLRVRTAFSSLFRFRFSLSVFGLVLTSFTRLLIVSGTVFASGSSISPSSIVPVSTSFPVSASIVSALIAFLYWFFSFDFKFGLFDCLSRSRFYPNLNIRRSLTWSWHFSNFLLNLHLTDSFSFRFYHSNRFRFSWRLWFRFNNSNFHLFLSCNRLLYLFISMCFNIGR